MSDNEISQEEFAAISEESYQLKKAIGELLQERYSAGGVHPHVLAYVGADMLAQASMALYGRGTFANLPEAIESAKSLVEMTMNEYGQQAAAFGIGANPRTM